MGPSRCLLVFLHGSGSNGCNLSSYFANQPLIGDELTTFQNLCLNSNIHLMTPTANIKYYSPMEGNSNVWYDRSPVFFTRGLEDTEEDCEGISQSWNLLMENIQKRQSEYDYIILGGHSMGGGMALNCLHKNLPDNVIGIFSIGSFLVNSSQIYSSLNSVDRDSKILQRPVYMMHGDSDPLIPIEWGKHTAHTLASNLESVKFESYEGAAHELSHEMLLDLLHWCENLIRSKDFENISSPSNSLQSIQKHQHRYEHPRNVFPKQPLLPYSIYCLDLPSETPNDFHAGIFHVKISFQAPSGSLPVLTSRQILACGAAFDIIADEEQSSGVYVIAITPDPHHTALEISKRLFLRMDSGSESLEPCRLS